MTLLEGIKNQGKPYYIDGCSRDNLPEFLVQMGCKVGAEIGVYKGEFTEKLCKAGLRVYGIDPWKAFVGQGRTQQLQERQDFLYEHTKRVLAPHPDCTLIRKTSMDALADFRWNSLDFVYIDGDHEFAHVAEDIAGWTLRVRPGGIVSGHDYYCTDRGARNMVCHVGPVVDAYVKATAVENFYTFGRSKELSQEAKNDKYLSWMWIR